MMIYVNRLSIHMKYQALFPLKSKKILQNLSPAAVVIGSLRAKQCDGNSIIYIASMHTLSPNGQFELMIYVLVNDLSVKSGLFSEFYHY